MQLAERARDAHVDAGDERGFECVRLRHDDARDAGPRERVDEREGAAHRADASVEAELAEHAELVEDTGREPIVGTGERDRDRELQPGSGLAHVGRREVDGDALHRPLELRRQERGADTLARFAPGRVGQADDRVARQSARDVDLDRDHLTVDTNQRGAANEREHTSSLPNRPTSN